MQVFKSNIGKITELLLRINVEYLNIMIPMLVIFFFLGGGGGHKIITSKLKFKENGKPYFPLHI